MNIRLNLTNEVKILKENTINNIFQHKTIIKPPLLQDIIALVIQFDKSFHPLVQYENYIICIFMNINET